MFGVQLDAMEMMRLANEDQEGFLLRMRGQFIQTAKSVDQMSLAEKRLIQGQLGLKDVESVERLLDPGRAISSIEDLNAAMGETGPISDDQATRTAELMDLLGSEMVDLLDVTEFTAEKMKLLIEDSMRAPFERAAIAGEQLVSANIGNRVMGPIAAQAKGMGQGIDTMIGSLSTMIDTLSTKMKDFIDSSVAHMKATGLIANSPSLLEQTYGKDVPDALKLTQEAMTSFTDISVKDLRALVKDSDSSYRTMAAHIGYLSTEYEDMGYDAKRALADQFKLGEDWEEKLSEIMSSEAATSGKHQRSQQEYVTQMLDFYKQRGISLESLGGAESDFAELYGKKYGITPEKLADALSPGSDLDTIVAEAIGEKYGSDRAKVAKASKGSTKDREQRLEQIRTRSDKRQSETLSIIADIMSKNLTESKNIREDIKSFMVQLSEPSEGSFTLDGKSIVDFIIEHPNHSKLKASLNISS